MLTPQSALVGSGQYAFWWILLWLDILISYCNYTKLLQTQWLKSIQIENQMSRIDHFEQIKCWNCCGFSGGSKRELFHSLFYVLEAFFISWLVGLSFILTVSKAVFSNLGPCHSCLPLSLLRILVNIFSPPVQSSIIYLKILNLITMVGLCHINRLGD